jgi:protein required for attachment to host cells
MKPVVTLIALVNDRALRLLVNEGVGKGLRQVGHEEMQDKAAEAAGFADQRGRSQSAPGGARHGMEPHETEAEHRRGLFAAEAVAAISAAWDAGGYDRLVIAAPPKMLGLLRAEMPGALSDALMADLDKDLVKTPLADLPKHFEDIAAF